MKDKIINLTFFGDSICVGQGVSIYRGWIPRIAESLYEFTLNKPYDVLVTNSSINGRTTRQALEDMPYHIQNSGVDLLIIQFGLNDCNYWDTDKGLPRVSLEAYIANIKEIYHRGKKSGAYSILLNTNHSTTRNQKILPNTMVTYEQSNELYSSALREGFRNFSTDLKLIDINLEFKKKFHSKNLSELLLDDGLHLSEKGHDEYFKLLYPVVLSEIIAIANLRGWKN